MSEYPSNAEKLRHFTDDNLSKVLAIALRQYAEEPTAHRKRVCDMYRLEVARRKQERLLHDLTREAGTNG